jgi:hypothetical protein
LKTQSAKPSNHQGHVGRRAVEKSYYKQEHSFQF